MEKMQNSRLPRRIGLLYLIFYGLGNVIGSGIYILLGKIAQISGYYTPLAFLLASLAILLTALCYAELSARYPNAAAEAIYLQEGLALPMIGRITALFIIGGTLFSSAALVSGIYGYLRPLVDIGAVGSSLVTLVLLSLIALWGIKESLLFNALFTFVEILGLGLILWYGIPQIDFAHLDPTRYIPKADSKDLGMILMGSFLAIYAYIGFEDITKLSEEAKNPRKNIPLAIFWTLAIVTILYVGVAFVAVTLITPQQLAKSDEVLATLYQKIAHQDYLLNLIALFSILNGTLVQLIMVSRLIYAGAKEGWFPSFLAALHPKTKTPLYATILGATLIFALTLWLDLLTLAQLTSFGILILFSAVDLALFSIKRKKPAPPTIYQVPSWVPLAATVLNISLIFLALFWHP